MDARHKDRVVHHLGQPSTDQEYAWLLLSFRCYNQGLASEQVVLILWMSYKVVCFEVNEYHYS